MNAFYRLLPGVFTIKNLKGCHVLIMSYASPYIRDTHLFLCKVTNTGNVDLTAVSVSNPGIVDDCSVLGELSVGSQVSCKGSYSLAWPEIEAGVKTSVGT